MAMTILSPSTGPVNRTSKSRKAKPEALAIQIVVQPLPLPSDFSQRLSRIYDLAELRYREHHEQKESQADFSFVTPALQIVGGDK